MSRILLFALLSLLLFFAGSCTGWQDETKGLGPALEGTTSGAGGGGACMGCNAFFQAASTCQDPDCPAPEDVCAGPSSDALNAFLDCAFCDACTAECPDMCGDAGAGISGVSGPCQICLIGAIGGTCATQYAACSAN